MGLTLTCPPTLQMTCELAFTHIPIALELARQGKPSARYAFAIWPMISIGIFAYLRAAHGQFMALFFNSHHNPRRALARAQRLVTQTTGLITVLLPFGFMLEKTVVSLDGEESPYYSLAPQLYMVLLAQACIFFCCVMLTPANRGRLRRFVGEWGLEKVCARPAAHNIAHL